MTFEMTAAAARIQGRISERTEPGTLFLLEQGSAADAGKQLFRAVLACPACGTLGLMTQAQYSGGAPMLCSADGCSAEYTLAGEQIHMRRPQ